MCAKRILASSAAFLASFGRTKHCGTKHWSRARSPYPTNIVRAVTYSLATPTELPQVSTHLYTAHVSANDITKFYYLKRYLYFILQLRQCAKVMVPCVFFFNVFEFYKTNKFIFCSIYISLNQKITNLTNHEKKTLLKRFLFFKPLHV